MVAELRHEEALGAVAGRVLLGEAVVAAVRRVHLGVLDVAVRHVVALDPGAEVERLARDVVLLLAGPHAVAAADALLDVDGHRPPVVGDSYGAVRMAPSRSFGRISPAAAVTRKNLPARRKNPRRSIVVMILLDLGVVGLVAARARGPVGMFLRVHLGKFRRLAHARSVARHAEARGIEFRRLDLRVVGMSRESAVARLAGKRRVAAPLLRVGDVGMTVEARGFSGEARGADAIVRERAGSIVPVTAEISGDEPGAHDQEREDSDSEDPRDPQEVASVSKKLPHLFRTLGGARPGETGSNASFRDEFQRASDR